MRPFYANYYEKIATAFGLEPRGQATRPQVLAIFTAVTAAAADGMGQAGAYDNGTVSDRIVIHGRS